MASEGADLASTTPRADSAATVPPGSVQLSAQPEDYSCPICLEMLLRPVKLSCGHHYCRGCWVRVLQSHDGRATARRTGCALCPFRCEVRPVVPEVDQALASQLALHFDEQYTERASAHALPDEERKTAEVNAWAAAGCALDAPEEVAMAAGRAMAAHRRRRATRLQRVGLLMFVAIIAALCYALLALVLVEEAVSAMVRAFLPSADNYTLPLDRYTNTLALPPTHQNLSMSNAL